MVWLRFIRRAQAGGPEAPASLGALAPTGLASPVTARPPAAKLWRKLDAARRSGLAVAETPASATPARPPAR